MSAVAPGAPSSGGELRIEPDTRGEVRVPRDALYAAQTQRAVENFPISGHGLEPVAGDGEVLDGALRLGGVQRIPGDPHLAPRVWLDA